MDKIEIKELTTYEELDKCVSIQRTVWGHADVDLTPVHQFIISIHSGGMMLGAYVEGELAGFVFSFPALHERELAQHSHLLAVLPQFQGRKLGKKLKWAQRDWALRNGYDLVTWTFDPLQSRNANLNLHTLGASIRTYLPDFYGEISSLSMSSRIPTDRFLVEWEIKDDAVAQRQKQVFPETELESLPRGLQRSNEEDNESLPGVPGLTLDSPRILAEIPRDINKHAPNPDFILAWQKALRETMMHYFSRGYACMDFIAGGRCYYVLKKKESVSQ